MAKVTVRRTWPTGDAVKISINVDASYPDALDQARAEAKRAFADACECSPRMTSLMRNLRYQPRYLGSTRTTAGAAKATDG